MEGTSFEDKITVDENSFSDPMKMLPKPKFSQQILKQVIGENRANQVL